MAGYKSDLLSQLVCDPLIGVWRTAPQAPETFTYPTVVPTISCHYMFGLLEDAESINCEVDCPQEPNISEVDSKGDIASTSSKALFPPPLGPHLGPLASPLARAAR